MKSNDIIVKLSRFYRSKNRFSLMSNMFCSSWQPFRRKQLPIIYHRLTARTLNIDLDSASHLDLVFSILARTIIHADFGGYFVYINMCMCVLDIRDARNCASCFFSLHINFDSKRSQFSFSVYDFFPCIHNGTSQCRSLPSFLFFLKSTAVFSSCFFFSSYDLDFLVGRN